MEWTARRWLGPSTLVTAAFLGPGTVTVCTLAGVQSGYALLWVLVFSIVSTVLLQEMTARLGLVTGKGFGEAVRRTFQAPWTRIPATLLILGAIVVGNAAYQGGNLSGAVLGWSGFLPAPGLALPEGGRLHLLPLLMGGVAFGFLYSGTFKWIQNALAGLVGLMSVVFLTTAVLIGPDWAEVLRGMAVPRVPEGGILAVAALIGTTVVPYNLFLHASTVREKYRDVSELKEMRGENRFAVVLGGVISMAIVITSAPLAGTESGVENLSDMARQLEPLLGRWAGGFLGLGLFAAGISSAITAPLAAAYAANGILGWEAGLRDRRFRAVWMGILAIGVGFAMAGASPVAVIRFAQAANGVLLPLVVVFLVAVMNRPSLLGSHVNPAWRNACALLVLAVAVLVSIRSLNAVFGFL